jgi:predicted N-acetyltransferase YhbS
MYDFKPITTDTSSIDQIAQLLSEVFPETEKFSSDFIRWQYKENPIGEVVGFNAWADDELAAHYATIPVKWKINGELKKGLLSLNTATHANHRGKKLFTELARKTYQYGAEQGYAFVIGVANANSTPGFLKKLDFKLIAPLDAYISTSSKTSAEGKFKSHSLWEKTDLEWRLSNPSNSYQKKGNTVFSKTHISALKAVMGVKPISKLQEDSSIFKLHIGLNHLGSIAKLKIPKKMQPSPLNLIYLPLEENNPIPAAKDILFRLIDFDAY